MKDFCPFIRLLIREEVSCMKKIVLLLMLMLLVVCCAAASAAPAFTDGAVTAWISDHDYLYLQSADAVIRQMPMAMEDLLQITTDEIICLTKEQQIIAIKKDGSGSRIVTGTSPDSLRDHRVALDGTSLSFNDSVVSSSACAAVTDGTWLYYVENTGSGCALRVKPAVAGMMSLLPGTRDAFAAALADKTVPEPLSLVITREALTLTAADHQVIVMDLVNGDFTEYPAASTVTAAAAVMSGSLYRYILEGENKWTLESTALISSSIPTTAPVHSPTTSVAPTAAPTATPTPWRTTAPTVAPDTGSQNSYYDDDGTIHRGAYGRKVRKIQERLNELGYPAGVADSRYGEQTQLAINLFCDAIHVREHQYITKKVQNRLFAKDAPVYDPYLPLKKGDQGISVLYMQRRLKDLGYDPGKLDGVYGKMTVAAVARFQKDFNIKLAGKEIPGEVASHEMLEILYSPDPQPVPGPQPNPDPNPNPNPATQTDM